MPNEDVTFAFPFESATTAADAVEAPSQTLEQNEEEIVETCFVTWLRGQMHCADLDDATRHFGIAGVAERRAQFSRAIAAHQRQNESASQTAARIVAIYQ